MSDEDKNDDVGEVKPDKDGKHPDTVSWSQYVGIKESLGGKLDTSREKVTGLEEKLKNASSPEELTKVKGELEETQGKLKTMTDELNTSKEATLTEKRGVLTKLGVPEEKVKEMSVGELNAALIGLEHSKKPGADLGGGGGGGGKLEGSPLDLALRAYS